MQDRQLFEQILGLERPWSVARIELNDEQEQVHVFLEHSEGVQWRCPECGRECPVYDHRGERQWRHLDTCQYQTILHASIPRTNCREHGPRVARVSWAEPGSRFTALFERLAIDWLREASQAAVARRLKLSWDEVHGIMERAVKRGLSRRTADELPQLGIDEKSFLRGQSYATIVVDIWRGRVLYVGENREAASLDPFWNSLTSTQKSQIQAVAMDMCQAYVKSVSKHVPGGADKIVFDKFHVAKHLGEALDRIRRKEHKQLRDEGDDRLTGTKYDWLRNPANFTKEKWQEFQELRDSNLKTARGWALKEQGMAFWDCPNAKQAAAHFGWWYRWATHSRLEPMIKVAKMLKKHLPNLLTYFQHRITNANCESMNSKIQWLRYTARGFRNFQNFATAIYFHCGGLDLAPAPT